MQRRRVLAAGTQRAEIAGICIEGSVLHLVPARNASQRQGPQLQGRTVGAAGVQAALRGRAGLQRDDGVKTGHGVGRHLHLWGRCEEEDEEVNVFINRISIGKKKFVIEDYFL